MRDLLFLSHRLPFPPDKGDKIRAWNILQHLAKGWRVHLGCLIDDAQDRQHVERVRQVCADLGCFEVDGRWRRLHTLASMRPERPLTLGYFDDVRLRRWVAAKVARQRIDTAYVFCSAMAQYLMHLPRVRHSVLDMVDVDSSKWAAFAARADWPMRSVWTREARTLLAFERRAATWFDRTLLVCEPECRHFLALAPEAASRTDWVENGIDLARFTPGLSFPTPFQDSSPAIVFTGRMDYLPNEAACLWFANQVMPILRQLPLRPAFYIVGGEPRSVLRRLSARSDIHVTGRVADTRPYLAHAAVVVAPLEIAQGIQNKVLEAMAMGKPVVASMAACTGLRVVAGRDLLVAENAEDTARRVHEVIEGRHRGLGPAARKLVERHYDWRATLRRLDAILNAEGPATAERSARVAVDHG